MTEPHIAGHATHFLRRLDRVRDEHVEVALALYRDEALLREVMNRASVPEEAERIAIALTPGNAGPFVVVTRDGKFVTCLGEGMAPHDLFVVSRERLDVASAHVNRMRERLAAARALAPHQGEASRLWERLQKAGPVLHREDFEGLARWEPLLSRDFFAAAIDGDVLVVRTFLYLSTRARHKFTRSDETLLDDWYHAFWAWAHAFVLMHLGDTRVRMRELEERRSPGQDDPRWALTVLGMRFGIVGPSMRALWAVAQHARDLLPAVKAMPVRSGLGDRTLRELPLAAIGHASQKSRAEVLSALKRKPAPPDPASDESWRKNCGDRLRADLEDPEGAVTRAEHEVRQLVHNSLVRAEKLMPFELPPVEALPVDIALGFMACGEGSWGRSPGWVMEILSQIPIVVRARASDLFLPRVWAKPFEEPYDRKRAFELLDVTEDLLGKGAIATVRKDPAPGRNDPCPCGSGKKYKRCGAA